MGSTKTVAISNVDLTFSNSEIDAADTPAPKAYTTPVLKVHGTVATMTQASRRGRKNDNGQFGRMHRTT